MKVTNIVIDEKSLERLPNGPLSVVVEFHFENGIHANARWVLPYASTCRGWSWHNRPDLCREHYNDVVKKLNAFLEEQHQNGDRRITNVLLLRAADSALDQ